jgi:hypothetical protein
VQTFFLHLTSLYVFFWQAVWFCEQNQNQFEIKMPGSEQLHDHRKTTRGISTLVRLSTWKAWLARGSGFLSGWMSSDSLRKATWRWIL